MRERRDDVLLLDALHARPPAGTLEFLELLPLGCQLPAHLFRLGKHVVPWHEDAVPPGRKTSACCCRNRRTKSSAIAASVAASAAGTAGVVIETKHGRDLGGDELPPGWSRGRARARPLQLPPRLRRDADRARTASPSNQIWNGKGYGQRPADFSGVLRRCCLIRERTSRVASTHGKHREK